MDRLQLIRRLRIVASAFFAVAAVALCVLWARSYWWRDQAVWVFAPGRYIDVQSDRGNLSARFRDIRDLGTVRSSDPSTFTLRSRWLSTSDRFQGFGWHVSSDFVLSASPYWFLVLTAVMLGMLIAPLHPGFRFSLRTLLIVTTLVAVVLGMGVWAVG